MRLPAVDMELRDIAKCRAIVMFGPATPMSGLAAGVYFQVTLDPAMVSPSGEYIRFGNHPGDEILGWQRIEGMTVCEVLGVYAEDGTYPDADLKAEPLQMMVIV